MLPQLKESIYQWPLTYDHWHVTLDLLPLTCDPWPATRDPTLDSANTVRTTVWSSSGTPQCNRMALRSLTWFIWTVQVFDSRNGNCCMTSWTTDRPSTSAVTKHNRWDDNSPLSTLVSHNGRSLTGQYRVLIWAYGVKVTEPLLMRLNAMRLPLFKHAAQRVFLQLCDAVTSSIPSKGHLQRQQMSRELIYCSLLQGFDMWAYLTNYHLVTTPPSSTESNYMPNVLGHRVSNY